MATIDGKTITQCFNIVSNVGSELVALRETLTNMMTKSLDARISDLPCVLAGDAQQSERFDDSGWVCIGEATSLPLKSSGKGKKKIERYLGFQVSMIGDGIDIPGNKEPLLHVVCWSGVINYDNAMYVGFPLEEEADYPFEVVDERILLWGGQKATAWNDRSWVYSVLLTSLTSPDDLKAYVIEPALALLKGGDVITALPDNLSAIVRYPEKDKLVAKT